MGVITGYGTAFKDPASLRAIAAVLAAGIVRRIHSIISITLADSANSVHRIAQIPADAIIDPLSRYDYEATGLSEVDIGLAYPNGAVISANCLVDGDDISSAGSQTLTGHGTLTLLNFHKRAWELAGLTSNPGGNLDIVLTQLAGTAATKKVVFGINYSKDA